MTSLLQGVSSIAVLQPLLPKALYLILKCQSLTFEPGPILGKHEILEI